MHVGTLDSKACQEMPSCWETWQWRFVEFFIWWLYDEIGKRLDTNDVVIPDEYHKPKADYT